MARDVLTEQDLSQIEEHGLAAKEVLRQLDILKSPPPYLKILRPCRPGDGIKILNHEKAQQMSAAYESAAAKGRSLKFVPASGAATRMFKSHLKVLKVEPELTRSFLEEKAQEGDEDAQRVLIFMAHLEQFAFFEDLVIAARQRDLSVPELRRNGRFREILRLLLTPEGLDYAALPKGLIKFHRYPEGSRTAFEEHLAEAPSYTADADANSRLHFTVSPAQLRKFQALLERVRPAYEAQFQVSLEVGFSRQEPSTDTIAVDKDRRLFRRPDGRIFFRPGGHGALLANLNALEGDIVFIKNIDNVAPDPLKGEAVKWKKVLGGYLVTLQSRIFEYARKLSSGSCEGAFLDHAFRFLRDELSWRISPQFSHLSAQAKEDFLFKALNRPLRVCGMVRNVGEPGGGPFWVQDRRGGESPQIVELVQIDPDCREQFEILRSATHFNPVDLVCGLRDWQGRPYDLRKFVDPEAVVITKKSADGKDLWALEHPGLWNGSMAFWNTVFVEVPNITFSPVKTVNDLLREEHQGLQR